MRQICKFNSVCDLQKTVPDMSVDLEGAIESGIVLDTGMIAEHNDIDNPASVIGRVRDVFDAFEAQKNLLSKGRVNQPSASSEATSTSTEV